MIICIRIAPLAGLGLLYVCMHCGKAIMKFCIDFLVMYVIYATY